MKNSSVGLVPRGLILIWIVIGAVPISLPQPVAPQPIRNTAVPARPSVRERSPGERSGAVLHWGNEIQYLGTYSSDGKFRTTTHIDHDVGGRNSQSGLSRS